MQMSVAEIKRVYSQAKHKKKQVSILADLNGCSLKDILNIVHTKEDNLISDETLKEEWAPTPEQKALIDRLEELDGEIRKLEIEYEKVARKLCEGGAEVETDRHTRQVPER